MATRNEWNGNGTNEKKKHEEEEEDEKENAMLCRGRMRAKGEQRNVGRIEVAEKKRERKKNSSSTL